MSISSGRIAEFLSRAQNINERAKVFETNKPSINPIRTTSNSPVYNKKPQLSPISHQSFTSTHDGTPVPTARKFILTGSFPSKKAISVPPKEKNPSKLPTTKEKTEVPSNRESISSEISQKKAQSPKNSLEKVDHSQQVKEIEAKGKKKLKKVIEIFKQEALKTDHKLKSLQMENHQLKDILNSPQLPAPRDQAKTVKSVIDFYSSLKSEVKFEKLLENLCQSCKRIVKRSEDYEKKIPNWFECLEIKSEEFGEFLSSVCKKILAEERRRMKTEEETGKMIECEEACVRELEMKILRAETLARSTSVRVIEARHEEDEGEIDREQICANLRNLIMKKTSVDKIFAS